jgi:small ligand-binding sensory domain FIST
VSDYAAGLSEHPDVAVAVGEAFGEVLDGVGEAPDVAVLFVSAHHVAAMTDIVDAVHHIVGPAHLIGTTTGTVIGGHREVENAPAVALWAKRRAPGARLSHLDIVDVGDGPTLTGVDPKLTEAGTIILIGDPFTFPAGVVLDTIGGMAPRARVVGGLCSGAMRPGDNRLVFGREIVASGGVMLSLPIDDATGVFVSQGCRPVGEPYIVTDGSGNQIRAIAGRPPLDRLRDLLNTAEPEEQTQLRSGVHIGKVIDESKIDFGPGDFLIRGIAAIDQSTGAMTIGDHVTVGDTVQFHVRDAHTATDDLRSITAEHTTAGLLFTCNGRGSQLFDQPDHDAWVVQDVVGPLVLAGMACAGEFGPVGGRNFLHSYTASLALFDK